MNNYSTDFQQAVENIKNSVSSERVKRVVETMDSHNFELVDVDEELSDIIHDYMEEYGADNDLPEGWWEDEAEAEDIVRML